MDDTDSNEQEDARYRNPPEYHGIEEPPRCEEVEIGHEDWKDISDETGVKYHWHAKDPGEHEYISIRLSDESSLFESLGGYLSGWTVEIYPNPDSDDGAMERWHYSPDDVDNPRQAAIDRVEKLMEQYG